MSKFRLFLILFILALAAHSVQAQTLTTLGIPCSDMPWYARNPWAMTFYDGKVYVGCGNASNFQPASNAGPVPLWYWTAGGGWHSDFTIADEQISVLTTLNGVLAIPGMDAKEGWDFGNWYDLLPEGWVKHRTIPNGVHVFDITLFNGKLWTAEGTSGGLNDSPIAYSSDGGITWTSVKVPYNGVDNAAWNANHTSNFMFASFLSYRAYGLFSLNGELYANMERTLTLDQYSGYNTARFYTVYKWTAVGFIPVQIDLPGNRVVRPVKFSGGVVAINANTVNDQQWLPLSVVRINPDLSVDSFPMPLCSRPQDTRVQGAKLYLLCNSLQLDGSWRISVQSTTNMTTWTEVASAIQPAFGRSFTLDDLGNAYIGLGGDTNANVAQQAAIGTVLQLPLAS